MEPKVCIAEVRRAAKLVRASGAFVTPETVARVLGKDASTLRYQGQSCLGLQDIFELDPRRHREVIVPRIRRKDIDGSTLLKWLLERLRNGGQDRHPELRFS